MMRSVAARRSLVTVSAMPDDSQASDASPLTFSKSSTATVGAGGAAGSRTGGGGGGGGRDDRFDGRDEAVAAARDRLDVLRVGGIVAERLTQLGHRLRQRVVGDRHVGPQGPEQIVLRDQHRRPGRQKQQQVDDLRRERDVGAVAQQPVGAAVDDERPELVGGGGGHGGIRTRVTCYVQRATVQRANTCDVLTCLCHVRRATCHGATCTIEPHVAHVARGTWHSARGTALRT